MTDVLQKVSEGSAVQPPVPMVRGVAMKADAAPVPVAAGEQTIAVDVNVIWEIKQQP